MDFGGTKNSVRENRSAPRACRAEKNHSMKYLIAAVSVLLAVPACAQSRSIVIPERAGEPEKVAIVPFKGDLGLPAMDLIAGELAARGIPARQGASVISVVGYDTNITDSSSASAGPLQKYGEAHGVDFILAGTAETVSGPLYAFDRVKISLVLIDVRTGQTRWIGQYGDTVWAAAIDTQSDLAGGARQIVEAFDNAGADDLVR
jgi:TolB-like protein